MSRLKRLYWNLLARLGRVHYRPGHEALWGWFGLSYASFLVLPRVLMHEMPDDWQAKMTKLLQEYDETFDFSGMDEGLKSTVSVKKGNKYTEMPAWLVNYRHPQRDDINRFARSNSGAA